MPTQTVLTEPCDLEAARLIVDALLQNPARNEPVVRLSLHQWGQVGCHHFAQAAKACFRFEQRNAAGEALRSLANLAIMREHQQR